MGENNCSVHHSTVDELKELRGEKEGERGGEKEGERERRRE